MYDTLVMNIIVNTVYLLISCFLTFNKMTQGNNKNNRNDNRGLAFNQETANRALY